MIPASHQAAALMSVVFTGTTLALPASSFADIIEEAVSYTVDGTPFEGHIARNTGLGDTGPTVMIIHDWDGLDDYERYRARALAELGYTAVAIDLYGEGVRPETVQAAQAESGALYEDRDLLRSRLAGSLEAVSEMDGVDPDQIVVMGYCFGGAAVLEMARAGMATEGFIVFHGGLATPEGQTYDDVQAPILLLHGTADPVAPMSAFAELTESLDAAGVEHESRLFGGVAHAFTLWSSSDYDLNADRGSWDAMAAFLDRRLRE